MSRLSMHFCACDYGDFLGYLAYAACALAVPTVLPELSQSLHFPLENGNGGIAGALHFWRSCAMMVTMLTCAFIAGRWGKRLPLGLALVVIGLGIFGAAASSSYAMLAIAIAVSALGQGIFEVLVTPLAQELHHDDQPARYINFTHSFWSLGVVFVMVLAGVLVQCGVSWRAVVAIAGALALIPGGLFLVLAARHPSTPGEQRPAGVVWAQMKSVLSVPRFFFFLLCIMLAGGLEHCLLFWMPTYISMKFHAGAAAAGIGTAVFACGMLIGRMTSGIFLKQQSTGKLVIGCAITAAAIGCYAPFADNEILFFAALFAIGLCAGPLWPGVQSHCLNRITDRDQTTMLLLLPCVGVPGCGIFTWLMGALSDHIGLTRSFFTAPSCALLLALLLISEGLLHPKAIQK